MESWATADRRDPPRIPHETFSQDHLSRRRNMFRIKSYSADDDVELNFAVPHKIAPSSPSPYLVAALTHEAKEKSGLTGTEASGQQDHLARRRNMFRVKSYSADDDLDPCIGPHELSHHHYHSDRYDERTADFNRPPKYSPREEVYSPKPTDRRAGWTRQRQQTQFDPRTEAELPSRHQTYTSKTKSAPELYTEVSSRIFGPGDRRGYGGIPSASHFSGGQHAFQPDESLSARDPSLRHDYGDDNMRKYQRSDMPGCPSDRQYQSRKTSESSQPSFGSGGGRGDSRDNLLDRHNNRLEQSGIRRQPSKQADFYSYSGSDPMVARAGGLESPGRAGEPQRPPAVDHKNRRTRFKQVKSYSLDCHPETERDDYADQLCPPRRLIPKAPGESESPRYSRESLNTSNFNDRTFAERHESSAQNLSKYGGYNDSGRPPMPRKYDDGLNDKNCHDADDWDYKRNSDTYGSRERSCYPLESDSDRYKQPPGILRNAGLQEGSGKFYGGYDDQISPRSRMLPPVVEKRPEDSRSFPDRGRRLEGSKEMYSKMLSQLDEYYDPADSYHQTPSPPRHRGDYNTPVRRLLPEPKIHRKAEDLRSGDDYYRTKPHPSPFETEPDRGRKIGFDLNPNERSDFYQRDLRDKLNGSISILTGPSLLTSSSLAKRMVTLYDYDPIRSSPNYDHELELSFRAGDLVIVYGNVDKDGFYLGELNGNTGLVPSNFLAPVPPVLCHNSGLPSTPPVLKKETSFSQRNDYAPKQQQQQPAEDSEDLMSRQSDGQGPEEKSPKSGPRPNVPAGRPKLQSQISATTSANSPAVSSSPVAQRVRRTSGGGTVPPGILKNSIAKPSQMESSGNSAAHGNTQSPGYQRFRKASNAVKNLRMAAAGQPLQESSTFAKVLNAIIK